LTSNSFVRLVLTRLSLLEPVSTSLRNALGRGIDHGPTACQPPRSLHPRQTKVPRGSGRRRSERRPESSRPAPVETVSPAALKGMAICAIWRADAGKGRRPCSRADRETAIRRRPASAARHSLEELQSTGESVRRRGQRFDSPRIDRNPCSCCRAAASAPVSPSARPSQLRFNSRRRAKLGRRIGGLRSVA